MLAMSKLVLVDGHALFHRAFHAMPPLTTSKGELVNAVFGFTNMLLRAIADIKPEYIAVTFDTAEPTFRHQAYNIKDLETIIVTGDRDSFQLARPRVKIYTPGKSFSDVVYYDQRSVEE